MYARLTAGVRWRRKPIPRRRNSDFCLSRINKSQCYFLRWPVFVIAGSAKGACGSQGISRVPAAPRAGAGSGWLSRAPRLPGAGRQGLSRRSEMRARDTRTGAEASRLTKPAGQGPHPLSQSHSCLVPGREGAVTALHAGAQSDGFAPGTAVPPWSAGPQAARQSRPAFPEQEPCCLATQPALTSVQFPGRRNWKVNPRSLFFPIKKEKMFG